MIDTNGAILTIEEAAKYLRVSKSTLYKLVREGGVPGQKVGRHWRFSKSAIDQWFQSKPNAGRSVEE